MPATTASVTLACPACQGQTSLVPVTALSAGGDAVKLLFAGKLNRVLCPHCQGQFLYEAPITYRDDVNRTLIYYLPKSLIESLDDALTHLEKLYQDTFADLAEDERPDCRLAVQRQHFIEKIALHEQNYDDRVVEYIKYQLYQHSSGLDPVRFELLFDFGSSDDDNLQFLAFDRETGKVGYTLGFTHADYEDLLHYFLDDPEAEQELDRLFRGAYVQVDDLLE